MRISDDHVKETIYVTVPCRCRTANRATPPPAYRWKVKDERFEVFTAVTMKNDVFWDIKTQFIPHRRHITSPLQSSTG
jgi:hypothetical protein